MPYRLPVDADASHAVGAQASFFKQGVADRRISGCERIGGEGLLLNLGGSRRLEAMEHAPEFGREIDEGLGEDPWVRRLREVDRQPVDAVEARAGHQTKKHLLSHRVSYESIIGGPRSRIKVIFES